MPIPVITEPWPPVPHDGILEDRLAWYAAVARWAPSKHNTQPWRFVVREGALEVWSDPRRALPHSDPEHREQAIACGAALHLAGVAARSAGHDLLVAVLEGDGPCLARAVESGSHLITDDDTALLHAVATRRTDRGPLDGEALPSSLPFRLQEVAGAAADGVVLRLVSTHGDKATLARLVERADRLLVRDPRMREEVANWVREETDPRADGVPGGHTRGAAASYRAEYVQRDFSTADSVAEQDRPGADRPVLGILCTRGDRRADWISAGQALAAVLLCAELAGAHASYLNQPVEEPRLRSELRDHLELPGMPQLVLRIGLGGAVSPTPRRDVDEVVVRA